MKYTIKDTELGATRKSLFLSFLTCILQFESESVTSLLSLILKTHWTYTTLLVNLAINPNK